MDLIVSLCSSLGITGCLIWYLYHNTAILIPRLTDKHSSTMEKITDKFSDTLREEREFRKSELDDLKMFIKAEGCRHTGNRQ